MSASRHPHPTWQLWTAEGFSQALELIYDDKNALVAGAKPDFEAYRKRLNASIKEGTRTIGQDYFWARAEGEKESAKMDRDWRTKRGDWRPETHRPYGNPGPGLIAHVAKVSKRAQKATFEWTRKRARESWDDDAPSAIGCSITVPFDSLLNVDAYKPGDFRQFFDDPRTRAEYLRWAPLLLIAEEFHAGNRKATPPQAKPPRRKTEDGSWLYQKRKRLKAFVGKAVRLSEGIETQKGTKYAKGSLWRVRSRDRTGFQITGIGEDGQLEKNDKGFVARSVLGVADWKLEIDPTIPAEKEDEPKKRGEDDE